jgi:hypothetical protein
METENIAKIQTLLLKLLQSQTDSRLGRGQWYLSEKLKDECNKVYNIRVSSQEIMATFWALVGQGLAYIDFSQSAVENWTLHLTRSGIAAASDEEGNPDNVEQYLSRLKSSIPTVSKIVIEYARESVISYNNRCYLASAVMLGVSSEAAFQEMAMSFCNWLQDGKEKEKLSEILTNSKQNYISKFGEFRKRVEKYKPDLPQDISDGMSLSFDSILDLLRIFRNEAGHPTGKKYTRDDAFINLQMFLRYLQKMYALKEYFDFKSKA